MNEIEIKVLDMLLRKISRDRIRKRLGITDDIFVESVNKINKNGYNFVIVRQKKTQVNPEECKDDPLVYNAMKTKLSQEQYEYMLKNLEMPRTQLAKKLNISKVALNLILDKGM